MMKYSKIMNDVIKAAEKTDCGNKYTEFPYLTGIYNGNRYVTEGHFLIQVPNYFNDELFHDRIFEGIGRFFEDIPTDILTDANITKTITAQGKNKKVHVFKSYENDIYINEAFLKYFDNCTFKGSNDKSPVYAFDNSTGECVGLALPIINVK